MQVADNKQEFGRNWDEAFGQQRYREFAARLLNST